MSNGNGKGTILEAFKSILSSPVGGWVLAVGIVGYMSWLMYDDLNHLREAAMPVIREGTKVAQDNYVLIQATKEITEENNRLLKELRGMVRTPSDNRTTIREIRDMLKEWEAAAAAEKVPTISNDQP